jgi:predicted TIM-barrel fold metal-dependent hydrolase
VWPTLELMVEKIGSDRLLWGTDMPFQNRFCTYRQSRRWIEAHCDFLDADSIADIMGGTAARVLDLNS